MKQPTDTLSPEHRQMLVMALATLANCRPGWEPELRVIAEQFKAVALFEDMRKLFTVRSARVEHMREAAEALAGRHADAARELDQQLGLKCLRREENYERFKSTLTDDIMELLRSVRRNEP